MKVYCKVIFLAAFLFSFPIEGYTQLEDVLRLTVSSGSYSDETIIRFLDVATDSLDNDWDALKLKNSGNTPNIYTVTHNLNYVINALHKPYEEKTVDLNLEVAFTGSYHIFPEEIGPFDSSLSITLYDKALDSTFDLRNTESYTFDASPLDPAERFTVTFSHETGGGDPSLVTDMFKTMRMDLNVYRYAGNLLIRNNGAAENATIMIYDLSGKTIFSQEQFLPASGTVKIPLPVKSILIISVVSVNRYFTSRVPPR